MYAPGNRRSKYISPSGNNKRLNPQIKRLNTGTAISSIFYFSFPAQMRFFARM